MKLAANTQPAPKHRVLLPLLVLALAAAVPATAQTVVFDQGPTTGTNGGCWSNFTTGQNFADKATLTAATQISAISIYTCQAPATGTVHVKILADGAGVPGAVLYSEDKTPTSWAADSASGGYKIRVVLTTPFTANAGVTYWYGVSGNGTDISQYSVLTPGDGHMAQFSGTAYGFATPVGDQMFQLEGGPAEGIPALGTWGIVALVGLVALAGVAVLRRAL